MTSEAGRRPARLGHDSLRRRALAIAAVIGFGFIVAAFWAWWPAGVVLGLVVGIWLVLRAGVILQAEALLEMESASEPADQHGLFDDAVGVSDGSRA